MALVGIKCQLTHYTAVIELQKYKQDPIYLKY